MLRPRNAGHKQTFARYCLNLSIDGKTCPPCYRLINVNQMAYHSELVSEGNENVEIGDNRADPLRPRASTLEMLDQRIETVRSDPTHVLNNRFEFHNRQFHLLGK